MEKSFEDVQMEGRKIEKNSFKSKLFWRLFGYCYMNFSLKHLSTYNAVKIAKQLGNVLKESRGEGSTAENLHQSQSRRL